MCCDNNQIFPDGQLYCDEVSTIFSLSLLIEAEASSQTFKERSDVPHVDAAGLHELSQSNLQEEDGDSPNEDDEEVRDQEDTCRTGHDKFRL